MHIACWVTKITDTLRMYNTYWFSTVIVVIWTRLNIMFIRAYLSCRDGRHKMGYEPCKVHRLLQLPNNQKFSIQATEWIAVIFVDLRTIIICFHVEHRLIFFCNWDGVCLPRNTNWIFKYNSGILFVFKELLSILI